MSPRTANVFVDLAHAAGLGTRGEPARVLLPVARGRGGLDPARGPQNVKIARLPNAEEMLAALAPETPESS